MSQLTMQETAVNAVKLSNQVVKGQIAAFRRSVCYGLIFVCVSCHRKMFEDEVVKYAGKIKEKIESYEGLFERTIVRLDLVPNIFNDLYYLCKTCNKQLCKGKMPSIMKLTVLAKYVL